MSSVRPIGSGQTRRAWKRAGSAMGAKGSSPSPQKRSRRVARSAPKRIMSGGARQADELPDRAQADPAQRHRGLGCDAQRPHRQVSQALLLALGGEDAGRAEAGPGPGPAHPPGDRGPDGEALAGESPLHGREQARLAAEKMRAAGDVEHDPVGAVDGEARAPAPAPQAQRPQRFFVIFGLGLMDQERRQRGSGVGQRQSRPQPGLPCRPGQGGEPRHAMIGCCQRQRLVDC